MLQHIAFHKIKTIKKLKIWENQHEQYEQHDQRTSIQKFTQRNLNLWMAVASLEKPMHWPLQHLYRIHMIYRIPQWNLELNLSIKKSLNGLKSYRTQYKLKSTHTFCNDHSGVYISFKALHTYPWYFVLLPNLKLS